MGKFAVKNKGHLNHSDMYCPVCKNIFPIPRPYDTREKYHRKDMWCPFCKQKQKMIEIRFCDLKEEIVNAVCCEEE